MEKRDYNQLLTNVILMPLIDPNFNNEDPLYDYSYMYAKITDSNICSRELYNNLRKKYKKAKNNILELFLEDSRWNHLDDALLMVDKFYSQDEISRWSDFKENDPIKLNLFYISRILNIARTFITFRDGAISIRYWSSNKESLLPNYSESGKIELWNYISRTAVSDLFIAAAYVNSDIKDEKYIFNVPNLIYMSDMPLKKILNRGVAETHLHFNAGISYQFLWTRNTSLFDFKDKTAELWFCTFFRFYSGLYLENGEYDSFEEFYNSEDNKCFKVKFFKRFIKCGIGSEKFDIEVSDKIEFDKFYSQIQNVYKINSYDDFLLDTVYSRYKYLYSPSEIIWYYKMLSYIKSIDIKDDNTKSKDNKDPLLIKLFLWYIRYKNDFFRNKIQQTYIGGLDYFQRYYDESTNVPKNKHSGSNVSNNTGGKNDKIQIYKSIFTEQCKSGNLKIFEIKIAPKFGEDNRNNILTKVKWIIEAYKEYIEQTRDYYDTKEFSYPKLGIVYHFIKEYDIDNFTGSVCIKYKDLEFSQKMDYYSMRKNYVKFIEALGALFLEYPLLTDYIVGIDAASIENSAEPWVFAPIFKKARFNTGLIPYSPDTNKNIQNIGFTYHVGEDFRHIISGLRHIDEVLTYFGYRTGDRLGHGLALGVDIDKLALQTQTNVIPIMEHLENLLWMWANVKSSDIANSPGNLEFKIMNTAQEIYKNKISGIDVYTLWRVYQNKFEYIEIESLNSEIGCPDKKGCPLLKKMLGSADSKNLTYENLLLSHFCPCFSELYNRPIFVDYNKDEIEFFKALQKKMINKVEKQGVYVETNPSSNLAIGDIQSIYDHPIIRLNNKGLNIPGVEETCVLTSINSDDPIVFSTFVENEIAYIYYSLLKAGCKREEALNWVDKIRQHGMDSSFIKHNKGIEEMLEDFEKILKFT